MAKKRITDITVERTALLTTDYIAGDSTTGTNNTCKISTPNLLAQLRDGPTSPTFQVKLSTLATAGLGGVSRLARGFDIFGSNPKATTAAAQYLFQVASNDAASPLALRFGVTTHVTAGSRNGVIEVDDAGTKRPLILQPTGGFVGIGKTTALAALDISNSTASAETLRFSQNQTSQGLAWYSTIVGANSSERNWAIVANATAYGDFAFRQSNAKGGNPITAGTDRLHISFEGNIGIGQTTFGAGAVKVMAFGNGTIPGTLADAFQLVSADVVAGNAAPHFVTEAGPIIRLYQQAGVVNADGTLADITTKFNTLLQVMENLRLLAIA